MGFLSEPLQTYEWTDEDGNLHNVAFAWDEYDDGSLCIVMLYCAERSDKWIYAAPVSVKYPFGTLPDNDIIVNTYVLGEDFAQWLISHDLAIELGMNMHFTMKDEAPVVSIPEQWRSTIPWIWDISLTNEYVRYD